MTADQVRHLFDYEPETGILRWRVLTGSRNVRVGDVAGTQHSAGYWQIKFDGRFYLAHRLAWLHVYGVWPSDEIDHIDRDRLNNRIVNLRDVTTSVNGQNLRGARSHSKTGILGAFPSQNGKRFTGQIVVDGRKRYLGTFDTASEAHAAYLRAKRDLHPGFVVPEYIKDCPF